MGRPYRVTIPHELMKRVEMKMLKNTNIEMMIVFGLNTPEDEMLRILLLSRMTDILEIIQRAYRMISQKYLGHPVDEYALDLADKITSRSINLEGIDRINLDEPCELKEDVITNTPFTAITRNVYMEPFISKVLPRLKVKQSYMLGYVTLCYLKRDPELRLLKAYNEAIEFFHDAYVFYRYRNIVTANMEAKPLINLMNKIKEKLPKSKEEKNISTTEINIDDFVLEL